MNTDLTRGNNLFDVPHKLGTPEGVCYTFSVPEFIESTKTMTLDRFGKELHFNVHSDSQGYLALELSQPAQAIEVGDRPYVVPSFQFLLDSGYRVHQPHLLAIDFVALIFNISVQYVDWILLDRKTQVIEVKILNQPKEQFFVVIHPSNPDFLRCGRVKPNQNGFMDSLLLEFSDQSVAQMFKHQIVEVESRDYDYLLSVLESKEHVRSILSKYTTSLEYEYYLETSIDSQAYMTLYEVSPLFTATYDGSMIAFNQHEQVLSSINANENSNLVKITFEEFSNLSDEIATNMDTLDDDFKLSSDQKITINHLKNVLFELSKSCDSDEQFNDWLSRKKWFTRSIDDLLADM
ncbi:hypothetical protein OM416_20585 [Paenibacillus sp. LS1]|uniref:hypothetical protein n=1 Tax=Paenibacillus sp. LS1 TaxID=2992120 RepID=UPI00222E7313|nr:hypothetical protein [Paenibacillus sp. LS1]MCW3793996.1 hypothetical protein [Paenibacillus sp. LS1]